MHSVSGYVAQHKERFLEELFQGLRIPSVSSNSKGAAAMYQAADFFKGQLILAGADSATVMETEGWPVVFGQKQVGDDRPTVLVYGHYDVQPPEPLDEWKSPPFEPEVREHKIFARGADDDKGQLFMHLKALEYMVAEKCLPCNIKFLIEGEEEMGSPSLKAFCKQHQELLLADLILVSDTALYSLKQPTLTTGLRGLAYFELHVWGPQRDLHSGLYGGAVANPVNELAHILSQLKDREGRIRIPGFYECIQEPDLDELQQLRQLPFDEAAFAKGIGVPALAGEPGYSVVEQLGIRPSLDVNGIWGGYTGEGAKTILPARAMAKLSLRLVPGQEPVQVEELLRSYLHQIAAPGVAWELKALHGGNAYVVPWQGKGVQAAVRAMEQVLGVSPLPYHSGGSIPVIADFEEVLGQKAVLLGFGLESDAIHAPNENFPLENFYKGIETVAWFYHYYTLKQ